VANGIALRSRRPRQSPLSIELHARIASEKRMSQTVEISPEKPGVAHGDGHGVRPAHLAHHFDTPQQQFDAGKLGIWIFLVTEILFFGGLFCAYAVYRANHPEIFIYAHRFLNTRLGGTNTAILIFSSLTMAWGVRCAQLNQKRGLIVCLSVTILCAFGFLGIKYVEYKHKWEEGLLWGARYKPEHTAELAAASGEHETNKAVKEAESENVRIFFSIYFCMTGLHAIHILIGIGLISWLLIRAVKREFGHDNFAAVDYVGLYWHVVDLIWIYLFPLLYLIH
jgi:cytochrome c oxidase subunit 3